MSNNFDDVTGTRFTFDMNHHNIFFDLKNRLYEITTIANERDAEVMFINVIVFIDQGQDYSFINVINFSCFEDLDFNQVTNTGFGHIRDIDGLYDFSYELKVTHTGNTVLGTNFGEDMSRSMTLRFMMLHALSSSVM